MEDVAPLATGDGSPAGDGLRGHKNTARTADKPRHAKNASATLSKPTGPRHFPGRTETLPALLSGRRGRPRRSRPPPLNVFRPAISPLRDPLFAWPLAESSPRAVSFFEDFFVGEGARLSKFLEARREFFGSPQRAALTADAAGRAVSPRHATTASFCPKGVGTRASMRKLFPRKSSF